MKTNPDRGKYASKKPDVFFPATRETDDERLKLENYSDQQLWAEFMNGNESAFAHIYSRFFGLLFNYGLKINTNRQMVSDCIQDLFVDIWNSRARLREVEWLKTYLIKSLRRRILKESKTETSVLSSSLDEEYNFQIELSHDMQLIRQEDRLERANKLNEAMQQLTDRQKEAIFLKYHQRLSYEQIADVMTITVKATYKVMARAIEGLKSALSAL
ncbi:MAG: sigma-70 family RNA polymerase sigma factor [Cyclobacteriaceae bacterium]